MAHGYVPGAVDRNRDQQKSGYSGRFYNTWGSLEMNSMAQIQGTLPSDLRENSQPCSENLILFDFLPAIFS